MPYSHQEEPGKLDRKEGGGTGRGAAVQMECKTRTRGLARLFSDLAKAAEMKSVSLVGSGLGESSGEQATAV